MVEYKNEAYLKHEIMGQSRHQFIYGYDNEKRKSFFHELDKDFPIKIDCNSPMAIYISEFGLPKIPIHNSELDANKIDILSSEYLSFIIAFTILLKSKENIDGDLLNLRIAGLLDILNKDCINPGHSEISSLDDLIRVLEQSKEFYRTYYIDYIQNGKEDKSINDIALPFLQIEMFISQYKRALNNKSYFGIILDRCQDISLSSTKAVNFLVGTRINSDISMKVVVEPDKWDSYIDANGQYVEAVHDYGIVELDDSQAEYVKKIKKIINAKQYAKNY